jgi:plasmid stabilization system protein ParE
MRRSTFAPSASAALSRQIDHLISVHALQAARALESRVQTFISGTLCHFPFAGTHIPERDLYECWIPGTLMIVWYQVTDNEIMIAMFWHTAQNRNPSHIDEV